MSKSPNHVDQPVHVVTPSTMPDSFHVSDSGIVLIPTLESRTRRAADLVHLAQVAMIYAKLDERMDIDPVVIDVTGYRPEVDDPMEAASRVLTEALEELAYVLQLPDPAFLAVPNGDDWTSFQHEQEREAQGGAR
jgi:hypothetical protein